MHTIHAHSHTFTLTQYLRQFTLIHSHTFMYPHSLLHTPCTLTLIHILIQKYTQLCTLTSTNAHTYTHTDTCRHALTLIHTPIHLHTYAHSCTHRYTCRHTHMHACAHMHSHRHTHTHTEVLAFAHTQTHTCAHKHAHAHTRRPLSFLEHSYLCLACLPPQALFHLRVVSASPALPVASASRAYPNENCIPRTIIP